MKQIIIILLFFSSLNIFSQEQVNGNLDSNSVSNTAAEEAKKDRIFGLSVGVDAYIPGSSYKLTNNTSESTSIQDATNDLFSKLKLKFGYGVQLRLTWKVPVFKNGLDFRIILPEIQLAYLRFHAKDFSNISTSYNVTGATIEDENIILIPSAGFMVGKQLEKIKVGLISTFGYTRMKNNFDGVYFASYNESAPYLAGYLQKHHFEDEVNLARVHFSIFAKYQSFLLSFGVDYQTLKPRHDDKSYLKRSIMLLKGGLTFNIVGR